jgi:TRAP-type mannitol/chloroaromatic compound transport system permease small subunit
MTKFISQPNFIRLLSYIVVLVTFGFLINNIFINFFNINSKIFNLIIYGFSFILPFIVIFYFNKRTLLQDSNLLTSISLYIAKAAFWIVFTIGITDFIISFLVSEKFVEFLFGKEIQLFLSSPRSRILFIHLPLVAVGFYCAYYFKTLGFIWLSTLVVIAEILIVISRFVYSYEQTFMGDLVRYWYGALFLFSSAHTLVNEGHVRVDILYNKFKPKNKAIANIIGSLFFGIPLCGLILFYGMQGKQSTINAPLTNFEVTQQGIAGLYVKYMMAGFLAIFAITMIIQFSAYILSNANNIYKSKK